MDTYDDPNYTQFEEYAKKIASENCVLSIFSYFLIRDINEIHSYEYSIDSQYRKNYPKLIEKSHICNWSYFLNGKFTKKINNDLI